MVLLFVAIGGTYSVQAQTTVLFTATITPGTLLTDIRDANGQTVLNPTVDFGEVINSVDCRNGEGLSATLGLEEQRIYVDNARAAFDGWTLTISPKDGVAARWQANNGTAFDINDTGQGGCSDSDGDQLGGLMSFDTTQAQVSADCLECVSDEIFIDSQHSNLAESPSITLLRANQDSDELGSWYLKDVLVEQTIPEGQEGQTYFVEMVLTATAT